MALALDGILRDQGSVEYRELRRKAFSGIGDWDPDAIASRMEGSGLAEWEIAVAYAMANDGDFIQSLKEPDMPRRSMMISSIARRNGIDPIAMYGMYYDAMIGSGLMSEDDDFGLFMDMSDVDDDVKTTLQRAKDGDADAQYEMGLRYRSGDGTFEDECESFRWLMEAAEHGHAAAMYEVGVCYDTGICVSIDGDVADEWYRKAADNGNGDAKRVLGLL